VLAVANQIMFIHSNIKENIIMIIKLVKPTPEEPETKTRREILEERIDAWKELHSSMNEALVEAEHNGVRKNDRLYALAMILADEIIYDDLDEEGEMHHTEEDEIPRRLKFLLPTLAHIIVEQYGEVKEDGTRTLYLSIDPDSIQVLCMRDEMRKAVGVKL